MSNDDRATAAFDALSADRFDTYLRECHTAGQALELYEWNATVSAAVMHLTGLIEVPVRNAMDRALSNWYASR